MDKIKEAYIERTISKFEISRDDIKVVSVSNSYNSVLVEIETKDGRKCSNVIETNSNLARISENSNTVDDLTKISNHLAMISKSLDNISKMMESNARYTLEK